MKQPAAERAFIGLGANLGEPAAALATAIDALGRLDDTRVVARSSRYRSSPVDAPGPDYLNQVVAIVTALPPGELLRRLQAIERAAGRGEAPRNAPRLLDLDLLLYGEPPLVRRSERLDRRRAGQHVDARQPPPRDAPLLRRRPP